MYAPAAMSRDSQRVLGKGTRPWAGAKDNLERNTNSNAPPVGVILIGNDRHPASTVITRPYQRENDKKYVRHTSGRLVEPVVLRNIGAK